MKKQTRNKNRAGKAGAKKTGKNRINSAKKATKTGVGKVSGKPLDRLTRERARELEDSEEIYRVLVESSPNLVLIIQDEKAVYVNPAVEKLTGVSADRLMVNAEDLIRRFIAPEYRRLTRKNLALRLSGEDVDEYEIELMDKDGNRRNVIVKSQIINYRKKLADMVLLVDISDHRRMERRLRILYQAIDQAMDGIAVSDLEGYILFANRAWAEMHGMEIKDIIGRHLSVFHSNEQLDREVIPFLETMKERGALQGEISHLRADGKEFRTWMSVTLLRNEQGEPVGMIGVARDITERKEMEDQAIRSERLAMAGLIASGIAHEINNPLTAIYASAQMLARESKDAPESSYDRIEKILAGSERIRELMKEFLDFARPAGYGNRIELNVNEVLMQSVMMTSHLKKKEVEVKTRLHPDLAMVTADPNQLVTVFTNLLINAHQALEGQGDLIEVETRPRGSKWVEVIIRDNGAGIQADLGDRIFDPFFSTKSSEKGTGLGLAIVQTIINSLDGNISFRSQQGSLTEFFVRLPACG